ncbi:serine hydrolase domain-containing protein [Leifsonia aquatica]|uniref:serine hydrolase domain-containing protein n=1 Tax=Leifsonia aquatica TaxID=144185 RepID=UPI000468E3A9|nr:serine hydrolase [Leifsonia aquatica]
MTAATAERRELLERVSERAVETHRQEAAVPGVVVGISVAGHRTVQGFGTTSVDDPLPVDGRTLFQIGSISKTFVALLVARAVAHGVLRLDQSVAELLPGAGVDPRITVLHLLTHSSGVSGDAMIRDAPLLLADRGDDGIDVAVARLAGRPLDFAPGSAWSYSNAGIMLAAAVLEAVDGRPYVDQLQEDIVRPLGMRTTFTTADEAITHRVAVPQGVADGAPVVLRDAGWQRHWQLPGWDVPGGGIVSTADDLLAYAEHLLSGAEPAALLDPHRTRDHPGESFALTWYLDDHDGLRVAWHDGLTTGYCARLLLVPSEATAVVVLTNGTEGERVHTAVAAAVVSAITSAIVGETASPVGLDPDADPSGIAGDYDAGVYGVLRLTPAGRGRLNAIAVPDEEGPTGRYQLPPPSYDLLAVRTDGDLQVVEPASTAGTVIGCRWDQRGRVQALRIAERLAPRMVAAPGPLVVVLGGSGGATTAFGRLLAEGLGVPFLDAGAEPTDERVGRGLGDAHRSGTGLVVVCPALDRDRRDALRVAAPDTLFLTHARCADLDLLEADEAGSDLLRLPDAERTVAHALETVSRLLAERNPTA